MVIMKQNYSLLFLLLICFLILLDISFSYRQTLKRVKRQNIGRPLSGGGLLCSNSRQAPSNLKKSIRQYLCNQQDYVYIGAVALGTPAQMLYFTFDSGSADTWVMTDECRTKTCLDDGGDGSASRFLTRKSNTFRPFRSQRLEFEYGYGGTVKGYAAQDTLCLAGVANTCLSKLDFLAGDDIDWNNRFIDGLLGLSYSADADLKGKPLLDRLSENGVLQEKLFAVWLNRNTSSGQEGGEISFGYTNSSRYAGSIDYLPVIEKRLWKVRLYDVRVQDAAAPSRSSRRLSVRSLTGNGKCATTGACEAIIDTGTSFIEGPSNVTGRLIDEWWRKGWIRKDTASNKWVLKDCTILHQLPNLIFRFGDSKVKSRKEYVLTPKDYTFVEDPEIDQKCDLKLAMDSDTPDLDYWVLGSTFIGKFYTIFDFGKDRIGLAVAKH